jgi:hypothetical protein
LRKLAPEFPFARWFHLVHGLGEEDPLLDVRRQQRQVEELGHPRTRESVVPGHVGVVLESPRLDLSLDSVGQAQQAHLRRGLRLPGHGHKDDRDHRALVPALRGPGDDPQFLFAGAHRQNQSASDPELLPQRRGH